MADVLKSSFDQGVLTLTLNRPDVFNSFNQPMGRAFQEALDDAAANAAVRCVVITGEGRAFCAGQDLKEVTSKASPGFKVIVEETYNRSIRRICKMEKPVIAAVNGVAAGAGANIALACDFVIAKSSATFIQAFANIGLIPDSGGTFWLPRLVGMANAKALTMLGKPLSAKDAESMGLIYKAVDDISWSSEVNALSNTLANMPTRGLGLTKKALHAGLNHDLHDQLALELELQFEAAETKDYAEGVQAFLEKRTPKFQGK
ncbi:MAG: enoyl-CoA hydratase-related protein [Bacteroidota bacterium]|nr:enoyl-CoA hydratase-related protein [Bacteroidota bacterium]